MKVNTAIDMVVNGEDVLMIDPIYLADVYNGADAESEFIRQNGIFVQEFGGDVSGPVILNESALLMPISLHYSQGGEYPIIQEECIKIQSLGCDSGSFVFLRMTQNTPVTISTVARAEVAKGNGIFLGFVPGVWKLYFEQFDAPQENMRKLYRNIVLLRA